MATLSDIDFTKCSLFFTDPTGIESTAISSRQLEQVPEDVLKKLFTGEEGALGALRVHIIAKTPHYHSLIRLRQFLINSANGMKSYQPFDPNMNVAFEVIDNAGVVKTWEEGFPVDNVQGLAPTSFNKWFCRELDLYEFAAQLGYTALLETSSNHIRTKFPVGRQETERLLERILSIAHAQGDQGLVRYILEKVKKHGIAMVETNEFRELLERTLAQNPVAKFLFDSYSVTAEGAFGYLGRANNLAEAYNVTELKDFLKILANAAVSALRQKPAFREPIQQAVQHEPLAKLLADIRMGTDSSESTSRAEADRFLEQLSFEINLTYNHPDTQVPEIQKAPETQEAQETPKVPDTPLSTMTGATVRTTPCPEGPTRIDTSATFLAKLMQELQNGNVFIADQDGYGTLCHTGGAYQRRNEDFRFRRGEVLLRETSGQFRTTSHHNVMVVNAHGQVGDVLGSLVRKADERLGLLGGRSRSRSPRR
ncbi:hypothetical protein NA57DRAFT_52174 [Rhizodiscina lignyota]|uniref:Uncharacterized protein n=1 Tax=Rhizodiscina lignyota TaxID=1504668 RepID=A0A9P4M9B6_9PEZI|nr:hypothetical protein NA57DRAFT_52174 [Rhizodiscina lignyota]